MHGGLSPQLTDLNQVCWFNFNM